MPTNATQPVFLLHTSYGYESYGAQSDVEAIAHAHELKRLMAYRDEPIEVHEVHNGEVRVVVEVP